MHTHYRTQGIFLAKQDRGEADRLFSIFTKDFGRVEVMGKAVRKITSKLRSGAEIFYLSGIEFIQGKTYKTLTDAFLLEKFKGLRQNPEKLGIAFKIAETADIFLARPEKDERIWQLLCRTLDILNGWQLGACPAPLEVLPLTGPVGSLLSFGVGNWQVEVVYHYFLWNFLAFLGYQPELHFCPICRKKMRPETFYFSAQDGGVICWSCLEEKRYEIGREAEPINVETVKVLRLFLKNPITVLERLKIEKEHLVNLARISDFYLGFLQKEFASFEN